MLMSEGSADAQLTRKPQPAPATLDGDASVGLRHRLAASHDGTVSLSAKPSEVGSPPPSGEPASAAPEPGREVAADVPRGKERLRLLSSGDEDDDPNPTPLSAWDYLVTELSWVPVRHGVIHAK